MFLITLKSANACLFPGRIIISAALKETLIKSIIYKMVLMSLQFFHLIKNCISQQITSFTPIQIQTLPFLQFIKFLNTHLFCTPVMVPYVVIFLCK